MNAKTNPMGVELRKHWQGQPFGRITAAVQRLRSEPNADSEVVREMRQDELVRVKRSLQGEAVYDHNDLWIETPEGYLYTSFVQPIWNNLPNTPVKDLGEGRWAIVTVPFTDAYRDPDGTNPGRFVSRLYYDSTFRVTDYAEDAEGNGWYRIQELYQHYWMRAVHLRLLDYDTEISPLSPDVPPEEKWIDVDLPAQVVTAYEGDTPVFSHLTSTGRRGHGTPPGTHYIWDKRLSERMVGGAATDDEVSDLYNLAGVAFTSYINDNWVALHGCFWHNDYGQVRSHGCINLPSDASQWIWRWSTPYMEDTSALYFRPSNRTDGTRVEVHY